MKANIITRNHNFENKLNWVKQNKKTIEIRHEKDTQSTYVYRTPEIDYAFECQDWDFFERLEMTVIDKTDIYDHRPVIHHKINTAGMILIKTESTWTYYSADNETKVKTIETWVWDEADEAYSLYRLHEKETDKEIFCLGCTCKNPLKHVPNYN